MAVQMKRLCTCFLEAGNVEKFEELLQKKLYNKEKLWALDTVFIEEQSTYDEGSFKTVM